MKRLATIALGWGTLLLGSTALAAGKYAEVSYPASDQPGELSLGVTYRVWIPDGVATLRGAIVHQHGCGSGACRGGETAAADLHWQALARNWDCALLGPSYHQEDQQNCRLWCDPRNGSERTFLRALDDLAGESNHPELRDVPWCLWGHSGGGFWASLMQTMHPERIVAIWFRSGTAYEVWNRGEIPAPEIPAAAYEIPAMCNPGAREKGDERFQSAWTGAMAMFRAYRAKGAPIGFAPDPRTAHECGDARYLAIPFFDACLALRLPEPESADRGLRPIDPRQAWLAPLEGTTAQPAAGFVGDVAESVWLPNESFAAAWTEYVATGAVGDTTPPPPPFDARINRSDDGAMEIAWDAEADFESGLASFVIRRDGEVVARLPEAPVGRFGRPLFQTMSYHDTPEQPLPAMRYVVPASDGSDHAYEVIAVNGVGLESPPAAATESP